MSSIGSATGNFLTLKFGDQEWESDFRRWIFPTHRRALLLAHILGGLMYSTFFIVDFFLLEEWNLELFLIRVIGMPSILVATGLILSSKKVKNQEQLDLLGLVILTCAHVGHFMIGYKIGLVEPSYLMALSIPSLLFSIHLCGLMYRTSFFLTTVVLLGYILMEILAMQQDWNQTFFRCTLMTFFVIATLFSGYLVEESKRRQFKHESDLEKQKKVLQFKNKELEQFAYIASHDLQEPLRTVSSFSDLLQQDFREPLGPEGGVYLDFISKAARRMRDLVKGLLDYSRLGRQAELSQVDANEIMIGICQDLHQTITETNATITWENLPVLSAYETEFRMLLQNLVNNGIKFRKNDQDPVIEVSATNQGDSWQFSVRDNGIGIEEEFKDRIFLIFQRLHSKDDYEGTGIGLSHCRKIVQLHRGSIWVESEFGIGSVFYFRIPFR